MQQCSQTRQELPVPLTIVHDDIVTLRRRLEAALSANKQMSEKLQELQVENRRLREENASMTTLVEVQLNLLDLNERAMQNPNITALDFRLAMSLVTTYPKILTGERTPINASHIRQRGGKPDPKSVSSFLAALDAVGYVRYEPGGYDESAKEPDERRVGHITANMDVFPFFELWKLKETSSRKKKNAKEKEKRAAMMESFRILHCEGCGSTQITYDVEPVCKCGYRHPIARGVDLNSGADGVTVDPFVDDLPNEPMPAFTDLPRGQKWPRRCRDWKNHKESWKMGITGLECPRCGG